jgi:hypothetical protein
MYHYFSLYIYIFFNVDPTSLVNATTRGALNFALLNEFHSVCWKVTYECHSVCWKVRVVNKVPKSSIGSHVTCGL